MDTLQQVPYNVLLLGDDGIDVYKHGIVNRISPEAPVPILNITHETVAHGMAGNVKRNLEAFGLVVSYKHGIKTSTKTRYIDNKSKHHLLRVDSDQISKPISLDTKDINVFDAVVISDYNKGSISYDLVKKIIEAYNGPIFVDTKKVCLDVFKNCFVKVNEDEYNKLETETEHLIVTLGAKGARYKNKTWPAPSVEMYDVCGAGDTFLSALVYKHLHTGNIETAIEFANKAAAISVQHFGVYALTKEDIDAIER
jgi:bifunctional ADP-heptose synthase (sugar kinase/adenylyltransferase)